MEDAVIGKSIAHLKERDQSAAALHLRDPGMPGADQAHNL
jgi:hypothetical protein